MRHMSNLNIEGNLPQLGSLPLVNLNHKQYTLEIILTFILQLHYEFIYSKFSNSCKQICIKTSLSYVVLRFLFHLKQLRIQYTLCHLTRKPFISTQIHYVVIKFFWKNVFQIHLSRLKYASRLIVGMVLRTKSKAKFICLKVG